MTFDVAEKVLLELLLFLPFHKCTSYGDNCLHFFYSRNKYFLNDLLVAIDFVFLIPKFNTKVGFVHH